jgi:putative transposase
MPEHVHLLICPRQPAYDISAVLASVKQSVVRRALVFVRREAPAFLARMADRQLCGVTHFRFWQRGGGYDRNVVTAEAVHQWIEYIHANPVRRGLCRRPEDWYWSSAADYAGGRAGPLRVDRGSLPGIVCVDEGRRLPRLRKGVNVPVWPPTKSDGV